MGRVPEYGGQQAREYLQYQRQRLLLRAEGLRRAKADRSQEAAHWEALAGEIDRVCAN